jgi:hypothetical protein
MTFALTKSASRGVAIASALLGGIFGLSFFVIRSDYFQRDCHNILTADWVYTANCIDAYNGLRFAGVVALVCLLALCGSVWRLRHA